MKGSKLYITPFAIFADLIVLRITSVFNDVYLFPSAQVEEPVEDDTIGLIHAGEEEEPPQSYESIYNGIRRDTKENWELGLHFAGIEPAEIYLPPTNQFHRHIVHVSPNITYGDSIEEMHVGYTVTVTDEYGRRIEVEYDILTEVVHGDERQAIIIMPFNPAYQVLDHEIRINAEGVFNPNTMEFREVTYEFLIEQEGESPPYLVRHLRQSILVTLGDELEEEGEGDRPRINSFAVLSDDDDDEDESVDNDESGSVPETPKTPLSGNLPNLPEADAHT